VLHCSDEKICVQITFIIYRKQLTKLNHVYSHIIFYALNDRRGISFFNLEPMQVALTPVVVWRSACIFWSHPLCTVEKSVFVALHYLNPLLWENGRDFISKFLYVMNFLLKTLFTAIL